MTESIHLLLPEEREAALKEAGYNLFAIKSIK
jgi:tryptophanase